MSTGAGRVMEAHPAVVAISSHVVRGAIGNRSVVHVLESFGFQVWSVPTVILPYHPGHGRATRIEPDPALFAPLLDNLLNSKWFGETAAIITGYMANAAQAAKVADFVAAAKAANPRLVYLCDPVIGDAGGLYVAAGTAQAIRDRLLPMADIATPNLHELAWLAGLEKPPVDAAGAADAARRLGVATVLVTSAPAFMRGNTSNLLVDKTAATLAEHRLVAGPGNGSGDLVAALFLAWLLSGAKPAEALEKTSASIFELMARAARRGSDELMPQADPECLARPVTAVTLRAIAGAAVRGGAG
ncbi:MAG: pyridoxal kinase [Nitratireductor sp.]|nr:pyridoxal kinase [Nitratireductor sp.]